MIGTSSARTLPLGALGFLGAHLADFGEPGIAACVLGAGLAGAVLGAWRGDRRWRRTGWLLDQAGFNLRRGQWWRSETRVPQSRVQHLDLRLPPSNGLPAAFAYAPGITPYVGVDWTY